MQSPAEKFAFVPAILTGTQSNHPDYLATVDVDRHSKTYGQVIARFSMPHVGDELHHYGWNACSSCHGDRHRRYLIVPGLTSGNVYIIDAVDPTLLKLHKTISGADIAKKTNLSMPHTVHCRADGIIMISMLGDAAGNAPGGFLEIDPDFNIAQRWESSLDGMNFNYDFWYQPRHNVMVSSEWAAPNTVKQGFKLEDVQAGKYGHHLHFWDWSKKEIAQSIDLGPEGMIPLEVRFHHNPESTHGFVGAALSSAVFHWHKPEGQPWNANKVIQVEPIETEGWPFPVPGLITDIIISLDDRYLYFSNWLHGDIRQYDISDPHHPKLTGQVWLGGVIGHESELSDPNATGGPQMLQLSLDGKRLYVTSSLYSVWDNQFYPQMAKQGSWMTVIDCDTERGGMSLHQDTFVDFGQEPWGPARAHE
ncbi:MAG: selenium-binding family protein, partial [Pirellulales bacterium]|nr:selenium-binding family protein [Pirellulales bacterium]